MPLFIHCVSTFHLLPVTTMSILGDCNSLPMVFLFLFFLTLQPTARMIFKHADNLKKKPSILLCPIEWNLKSLQQPINHAQLGPPSFFLAPPCGHQFSWALGLNKLLSILGTLHLWPLLFLNHLFSQLVLLSPEAQIISLESFFFFFWNNPGSLYCHVY